MRMLDELGDDRRHVERRRQQVIGERRIAHEAVAELHLLHHREPESLRDATSICPTTATGLIAFPTSCAVAI